MIFNKKKQNNESKTKTPSPNREEQTGEKTPLISDLQDSLQYIKDTLGESTDIIFREIRIGKENTIKAGIIYTDGLSDARTLQNFLMETLMIDIKNTEIESSLATTSNLMNTLKDIAITVGEIQDITNYDDLLIALLSGDAIFLVDGNSKGFVFGNKQWAERGVTEADSQSVVRGPREGFSENLRINTALVRRIIKDPNLWLESKIIGRRSKTNIAIMYIKGIAKEQVIQEVKSRLDQIDIDGVLESSYIEELIQDSKLSPFPTVFNSERPDIVSAALLEGRVAILVDGTPFVLVVPAIFTQFFQSNEDYYQRSIIASLIRLLRFFAFVISLLAPAFYISITTFHQEMIPTPLLISLASQRENVPFPVFIEVMIMEIAFEILREAGLRMPRVIGPAMSIVGGFVIGTAAVDAGIISAAIVIVVSITAIASFVSPTYDIAFAGRILRFIYIGLAAMFGLYGITLALIVSVLHLCSLKSFGISYMYPLAPFNLSSQKDTFIRLSMRKMIKRPSIVSDDEVRQKQTKTESNKVEQEAEQS